MVTATASINYIESVNAFPRLDGVFEPRRIVRPTTYRNPFVEETSGPIRTGVYNDPDAKIQSQGMVTAALETLGAYWQRLFYVQAPATVNSDRRPACRK